MLSYFPLMLFTLHTRLQVPVPAAAGACQQRQHLVAPGVFLFFLSLFSVLAGFLYMSFVFSKQKLTRSELTRPQARSLLTRPKLTRTQERPLLTRPKLTRTQARAQLTRVGSLVPQIAETSSLPYGSTVQSCPVSGMGRSMHTRLFRSILFSYRSFLAL